jgi:hypothetical protein
MYVSIYLRVSVYMTMLRRVVLLQKPTIVPTIKKFPMISYVLYATPISFSLVLTILIIFFQGYKSWSSSLYNVPHPRVTHAPYFPHYSVLLTQKLVLYLQLEGQQLSPIYLLLCIIFSGSAAQRGLWPSRARGFVITIRMYLFVINMSKNVRKTWKNNFI